MTSMPTEPNDMDFDSHLRSAKAAVPLSSRFQADVWRRIARAESTSLSGRLSRLLDGVSNLLMRPVAAAAMVLALVAGGTWLGSLGEGSMQDGKIAYVQSISPFILVNEDTHP